MVVEQDRQRYGENSDSYEHVAGPAPVCRGSEAVRVRERDDPGQQRAVVASEQKR